MLKWVEVIPSCCIISESTWCCFALLLVVHISVIWLRHCLPDFSVVKGPFWLISSVRSDKHWDHSPILFPVVLVSLDDPYLNHWCLQKSGFFLLCDSFYVYYFSFCCKEAVVRCPSFLERNRVICSSKVMVHYHRVTKGLFLQRYVEECSLVCTIKYTVDSLV